MKVKVTEEKINQLISFCDHFRSQEEIKKSNIIPCSKLKLTLYLLLQNNILARKKGKYINSNKILKF